MIADEKAGLRAWLRLQPAEGGDCEAWRQTQGSWPGLPASPPFRPPPAVLRGPWAPERREAAGQGCRWYRPKGAGTPHPDLENGLPPNCQAPGLEFEEADTAGLSPLWLTVNSLMFLHPGFLFHEKG